MPKCDVILIRNADVNDFGGAEKYQILLADCLAKHNLTAMIVTAHPNILAKAEKQRILHVKAPWLRMQNFYGYKIGLLPLYFIWQFLLALKYLHLFKKHRPRTVCLQSRDDFIAGTIVAKLLKIHIVWIDHADFKHILKNTSSPFKNPIGKTILKLSRFASKIILVSESEQTAIAKQIEQEHPFWARTIIIHNGAVDQYTDHQLTEKFIFGSTSRLVFDKGIRELITAFEQINRNNPDCELWLIGDGPDRDCLEQMTKNKNIKFLGQQNDVLQFMRCFDCFVQPTYHEALSLSLVEACMMKLPIIATSVGGNPEVIKDNFNGLLIRSRDSEQLRDSMQKIINNQKLARKLAKNARRTYKQSFDFSKIVKSQIIPILHD